MPCNILQWAYQLRLVWIQCLWHWPAAASRYELYYSQPHHSHSPDKGHSYHCYCRWICEKKKDLVNDQQQQSGSVFELTSSSDFLLSGSCVSSFLFRLTWFEWGKDLGLVLCMCNLYMMTFIVMYKSRNSHLKLEMAKDKTLTISFENKQQPSCPIHHQDLLSVLSYGSATTSAPQYN